MRACFSFPLLRRLSTQPEFWSIGSTVLRTGSGLLILPLLLRTVTTEELGLWYLLLSLGNLAVLVDMGLSTTITRFAAMLPQRGRSTISAMGLTPPAAGQLQVELSLVELARAVRRLYLGVSILAGVVILLISLFTYFRGENLAQQNPATLTSFVLFALSVMISTYARWISAILSGSGSIGKVMKANFWGSVAYLAVGITILSAGLGVVALALGLIIQPLVANFLLRKELNDLFSNESPVETPGLARVLAVMWPNSWRSGLISAGTFFILNANTLIVNAKLGLLETAQYGLSLQLVVVLANVGMVLITNRVPQLVALRVKGDIEGLVSLFGRQLVLSQIIFVCGSVILLWLGPAALTMIDAKTDLLPMPMLLFLLVYRFLELNHSCFATLVIAGNRIPFVLPALLSGAAIVFLGYSAAGQWGLWGILLSTALVQFTFNNWYPLWLVAKELGVKPTVFYRNGLKALVNLRTA